MQLVLSIERFEMMFVQPGFWGLVKRHSLDVVRDERAHP
jgi:hypothetical protein